MVSFKSNQKKLLQTLKLIKAAIRCNKVAAQKIICDITVTDGLVQFAVPGAIFTLESKTIGTTKAAVYALHFIEIVKAEKGPDIEVIINDSKVTIGKITIPAKTTFFENDQILRTIQLPINYTDADLLRLSSEGYTWSELDFNNLTKSILMAEETLKRNLALAYNNLKIYGVSYQELETITKKKIFDK
ncbi:MAG: hypothetical protein IPO27_05995 [Bacteroidetes bacterium]|nr:hypothetical protein [Bacteroidota bacterium]